MPDRAAHRSWAQAWSEEDPPHAPWGAASSRRTFRYVLPVVVSFLAVVPMGLWLTFKVQHAVGPLFLASALIGVVALLGARRWPGPTVVVVGLSSIVGLVIPQLPPVAAVPFAFAIVSACVRGARVWAFVMVGVALLIPLITFLIAVSPLQSARSLGDLFLLFIAVAVGEATRVRRLRYREFRAAQLERRQSEAERERVRIARELHDVLAHSLSSINVQAGVGLHLMSSRPERAAEALESIKATSKNALDDVRTVLGILRGDDAAPRVPEPDLSALPALVAGSERVRLENRLPEPSPSPSVQLALYRIVQESLTNASRHAPGAAVTVTLDRQEGDVVARIRDDGARRPPAPSPGAGRGILGMRERAELLGGSLQAHPYDGGFEVVARIPAPRMTRMLPNQEGPPS
ncbi:sensor histidine kinase [Microbacteriaceae bacterium VKM Ac-2854]|nr:sensor histidine kinase [Microbacteriaceae bacterium VKM Ac-2854]